MKFSSQPAVHFNGLWKTIEQWPGGRKDFLLHAFTKPNIWLLPLPSLPISSQSCRSFVCTVYFHFSKAEIMHKLCNHSHGCLRPFLNGGCAAGTTSYSTRKPLIFPLSNRSLVSLSLSILYSEPFKSKAQDGSWHWPLSQHKLKMKCYDSTWYSKKIAQMKTLFPSRAKLCVPVKKRLIYNPSCSFRHSVAILFSLQNTDFPSGCCQFILKHRGGFEGHAFKQLKYISTTRQAGVNEN